MRILITVGLGTILAITAIYGLPRVSNDNVTAEQQEQLKLNVISKQLPSENGVVPVELKCNKAELSSPNSLEKLSCVIRNNTNKPITAGAIYTSIVLERDGQSFTESTYGTFDTFLHPDFRETHKNNFILPGGEYQYGDLPVSYDEGITIKAVTMTIDYIEFSDNTSLGSNRGGARLISQARQGATDYRNWLAKKYEETRSLDAIINLLELDVPNSELRFSTESAEHGANMYRNFARRTYKTNGRDGLLQQLKHNTQANE